MFVRAHASCVCVFVCVCVCVYTQVLQQGGGGDSLDLPTQFMENPPTQECDMLLGGGRGVGHPPTHPLYGCF